MEKIDPMLFYTIRMRAAGPPSQFRASPGTPSRVVRKDRFRPVKPEPHVPDGDLMGTGIGTWDCAVFCHPAMGEQVGISELPVLIEYLDREGCLVFREQGTFAGCRAITPYHAYPLFKPEIKGDPLFKVDEKRGSLAFRSNTRRRFAAS